MTAEALGEELGLRGRQEAWFGVGLLWAFTHMGQGWTFYVPAGSDRDQVRARARQKAQEFLGEAAVGVGRSGAVQDEEPLHRGLSGNPGNVYENAKP